MKDKLKKWAAALCALLMTLTTAVVPAFALGSYDDYTITIPADDTVHIYKAYQILEGQYEDLDGQNVLTNVQWGTLVEDPDELSGPLEAFRENPAGFAKTLNDSNIKDWAQYFYDHLVTDHSDYWEFEKDGNEYTAEVPGGYYLVTDQPASENGTAQGPGSSLIIETAGDVSVTPKTSVPVLNKEIQYQQAWQKSGIYDQYDEIPFRITVNLPSNIDTYKTYPLTISDNNSDGLSFTEVPTYVRLINGSKTIPADANVVRNGGSQTITIDNLKADEKRIPINGNTRLEVTWSMRLSQQCVPGSSGNGGGASMTYPASPQDASLTMTTPLSYAKAYTFNIQVFKKNEEGALLPGAEFALYKKGEKDRWQFEDILETGQDGQVIFPAVSQGSYRIDEDVAPSGYNRAPSKFFQLKAQTDETGLKNAVVENESGTNMAITAYNSNGQNSAMGVVSGDVIDTKGFQLPATGSKTAVILIVIAAGAAAAGGWMITRHRKEEQ